MRVAELGQETVKRCTKCGFYKRTDEFPPRREGRDGLNSQCRECMRARARERHAADPDRSRDRSRAKYAANPGKSRERSQKWQKAHPERFKSSQQKYRTANREKIQESARARYAANPVRRRNSSRKWMAENLEKSRAASRIYVARIRAEAVRVYGGVCVTCKSTDRLELDHVNNDGRAHRKIEPHTQMYARIARTGARLTDVELQLLCVPCHHTKTGLERRK